MSKKILWETTIEPNLQKIEQLRKLGQTEEQIAKTLHVAYSTFKEYKANINKAARKRGIDTSALSDALKIGKEELIFNIKDSLYTRALGGYKKRKTMYKNINGKLVIDKVEENILEPDTTSIIVALKILDPEAREILNNNIQVNNTVTNNAMDNFSSFSEEINKYGDDDG